MAVTAEMDMYSVNKSKANCQAAIASKLAPTGSSSSQSAFLLFDNRPKPANGN
ncbi:hypothetical protein [Pseudomonas fluorescens]|uniref:hypothetical protein n=1 Tax=Pseudomonas fluorescens TaxID=294 RepID=UPI0014309E29|nr:hypothetical protein [Pseudomonas fluorescens]MDP9784470.1 hypothetical protein [Pseudomonas fluorescens]